MTRERIMALSRPIFVKFFGFAAFGLTLFFISCTQGVDTPTLPSEGETGAQVSAPEPEGEPCEREENADNQNCRWLAKSMKISYGGKVQSEILLSYDEQGRIDQVKMLDGNGQLIGEGTLSHNDKGVTRTQLSSEPATPGQNDYTKEMVRTTEYRLDSDLINRIQEKFYHGDTLDYTTAKVFNYDQENQIGLMANKLDAQNTLLSGQVSLVTLDEDTQKPLLWDIKETSSGAMGDYDSWEQISYEYDAKSGRTITMISRFQDCTQTNCDFAAEINPSKVGIVEYKHDDRGRLIAMTTRSQGILQSECKMVYNLDTQHSIQGTHPLEFFLKTFAPVGLRVGFEANDLFESYGCEHPSNSSGASPMDSYAIEWARYYELVPGAQAPTE